MVLFLLMTSTGSLNIRLEIIQIETLEGLCDLVRSFLDVALALKGGERRKEGQMGMTSCLRRLFAH